MNIKLLNNVCNAANGTRDIFVHDTTVGAEK
jgi:hypothetical protein